MHTCSKCSEPFEHRRDLLRHEKSTHGGQRWSCGTCGAIFTRSDALKVHQDTTNGTVRFRCDLCSKDFTRKDNLKSHKRKVHSDIPKVNATPKRPRLDKSWTVLERKKAFRDAITSMQVEGEGGDPLVYLNTLAPDIVTQIEEALEKETGLKFSMCLKMEFFKPTEPAVKSKAHFWCHQTVVSRGDTTEDKIQPCFAKIQKSIEDYVKQGSGWAIEKIVSAELHFIRYRPLRGSSGVNLPDYIKSKRAVINIRNMDDKCFLWCIIASNLRFKHLVHRECVDLYKPYEDELGVSGIRLPVELKQIPKFEKQNNLSINVYEYEGFLRTLYISEVKGDRHINLLLHEQHYFWIRNLDRLLGDQRKDKHKKFFCHRCLFPFFKQDRLEQHIPHCATGGRIQMSSKPAIQFENIHKQLRQPVVIYADFECLLEPVTPKPGELKGSTEQYQRHVPCGYGLIQANSCCDQTNFSDYEGYRGPDCVRKFLYRLDQIGQVHQNKLDDPIPLRMGPEDEAMHCSDTCHICKAGIEDLDDKVGDHCHMCGNYRGPAHNACNQAYRLNRSIVVIFHNLRGYDGHLLMQELGTICSEDGKELTCIAKSMEDYLSFTIRSPSQHGARGWSIRFVDSYQFLSLSLDGLVKSMSSPDFKALSGGFKQVNDISLLLRKGVYPYDYMDSPDRFQETQLPPKDAFYSKLSQENISDEDYRHAQKVWQTFQIQNMGEYHDHYLKSDTCQIADVFEQFRSVCLHNYGLDPAHYITLPSFAWDACLKITGVKLETLQDPDIYIFLEKGIRGGISVISHRYAKANNRRCPDYDPQRPTTFLLYVDANNLYGWAMTQKLPIRGFRWFVADDLLNAVDWATTEDGYVLEVDLEYPAKLHKDHSDYPLAPEKLEAPVLSPYCQNLKEQFGLGESGVKLIPNLQAKSKYIIHIRNLQQCLSLGMKLTAVHRVVAFEEEAWMEPYIMLNTRLRTAAASELAKNLFKLMHNAVFGKTMENPTAYQDVRLVTSEAQFEKLVKHPRFKRCSIFSSNLAAISVSKPTTVLDKPIYCGFTVLEASKTLMYSYHYKYVLKRYPHPGQVKLLFTDTDSFIYQIQTTDVYADMLEDQNQFDTSGYPKHHPLYSTINKKVIGKMKDELDGDIMFEFCGLRSKMYGFLSERGEKKRAKGITKATVKRIPFEDYTEALFSQRKYQHAMNLFQSKGHQLFSATMTKTSLSPYDDKRYILKDGITTLAYGHAFTDQIEDTLDEKELPARG